MIPRRERTGKCKLRTNKESCFFLGSHNAIHCCQSGIAKRYRGVLHYSLGRHALSIQIPGYHVSDPV